MKKEDLRPVIYKGADYENGKYVHKDKNGFFHKVLVKKDEMGSEYPKALIEDEDGKLTELHPDSFRFND